MTGPEMDWQWFKSHLVRELLPRWYAAAVTESGFFHAGLSRKWERIGPETATLVSQSRLIFVFSAGHLVTKDPHYRSAAAEGTGFLLSKFKDPHGSGFFWSVDSSGTVLDRTREAYGHAFVILALSTAARIFDREQLLQEASEVLTLMNTRFRDPCGGIIRKMSEHWEDMESRRTQNPMMHLFEAALELTLSCRTSPATAALERKARDCARNIARFLMQRRDRSGCGCLPEFYDKDWKPLDKEHGGRFSVGHQFEWAFLLSLAEEKGVETGLLADAEQLLNAGIRSGLDMKTGAVYNEKESLGWWEHSEAARALLHFACCRGRTEYLPLAAKVLRFTRKHFLDPAYGGWYEEVTTDGTPLCTDKGGHYKLDYHHTALCLEAIRLWRKARQ